MNNLIKSRLIVFMSIFLLPIFTSAAISSQSNINQDSTLVMVYTGKSKQKKNHIFQKGDRVIYTIKGKKHKVEIIGFDGKDVVIKDLKTKKISNLNLEEVEYFKEYNVQEEQNDAVLTALAIIGGGTILGLSFGTRDDSFDAVGIVLLIIIFVPILLIIGGAKRLSSTTKRPFYKKSKGYRFDVKG